jgi:hypothetical protein
MRDWSLGVGDPLYLTLAADARLGKPDYVNDHIWEVELGASEPPVVGLYTTYGLRARSMRLFLRFTENGNSATDPNAFPSKPRLRRFHPSLAALEFVPLENLAAAVEFWIPDSHSAAGRIALTNRTTATRQIHLEVCGALAPLDGQPLIPLQQQMVNILAGQTGGLVPVIFMTGGPKHGSGPHPSLMLDLELGPGSTRQLTFAQAALDTIPASFELARHTAARPWEAERARMEMLDAAHVIDIRTGDADWDAALMFSQKAALGLFFAENDHMKYPSFVQSRQADHGFSRKGDGTDYPPSWSGQSPLESYYLSSILHGAPHVMKSLLANFLAAQNENGEIDHKPGLAAQRGKLLAAPMLASLAWKYHQISQDEAFLSENYSRLAKFFWSWFSPEHDRNRDGAPEWDHILQTGFEDNPIFDVWHPWSQGLDVSFVHSPSLEAMLYREAQCLIQIAQTLDKPDEETMLIRAQAETLKASVNASWNARSGFFAYRDRDTGLTQAGRVIAKRKGAGSMRPKFESAEPVRLLIEVQTKSPAAKRPEVEISEFVKRADGNVELIESHQFQWHSGGLIATSQKTFTVINRISVRGLDEKDRIVVKIADMTGEDITLALPLWARIPDQQRAQVLIGRSLLDAERFDKPFGIPSLPLHPDPDADTVSPPLSGGVSMSVHLPWNALIGEGLLQYGFRAEATRLTAHVMNAVIQNLKQNRSFYQRYHAERGAGIGERNSLHGLAPLGLFLEALGVKIFSAQRVGLAGKNLFPWPVTIKYKGLTIVRAHDKTVVTFLNGETVTVTDTAPCVVEM